MSGEDLATIIFMSPAMPQSAEVDSLSELIP